MPVSYMQPLRNLVQFIFLGFMLWLGYRLHQFAGHVSSGGALPFVPRPEGIEGFLPISGLLGTTAWLKGYGINAIHPAAVIIFLTVLTGAFLLRRSFCSWICPIATASEFFWKTGFRLFRKNPRPPRWLDTAARSFKYLLLVFFLYSITIVMSPEDLLTFIYSDNHKIADLRLLFFFQHLSWFAMTVIVFLLASSLFLRNPFCRYLCPYGALLGLLATVSPFRVTRDPERCISCGICNQVCPSYIDIMHQQSTASPECIGCWRCISNCRFNEALSMRTVVTGRNIPGFVFALLVVLVFWGGSVIGKWSGNWESKLDLTEYRRILEK